MCSNMSAVFCSISCRSRLVVAIELIGTAPPTVLEEILTALEYQLRAYYMYSSSTRVHASHIPRLLPQNLKHGSGQPRLKKINAALEKPILSIK